LSPEDIEKKLQKNQMFSPSFLSFFDQSGRKERRVLKTHDRSLSQNKAIHIFGALHE